MRNLKSIIRITSYCGLLLALILSLGVLQSAPVKAANQGKITGRLLDGSNQNAPLANQHVTLQVNENGEGRDLTTITTDQDGKYSFEGLDTNPNLTYAVYIRYQGGHYLSDLVNFQKDEVERTADLTVYHATQSTEKLAVGRSTVLVQGANLHNKTVTISQIFVFTNLDTKAYVGSLDGSNGKPNALRFSLPKGASAIKLDRGFEGYEVVQVDNGFATDAIVPPGDHEFSFSYEVPYTSAVLDLNYHTVYPTLSLLVMVPPDLRFSSETLQSQGVANLDQGRPYNLYGASGFAAQEDIPFRIEGLYLPDEDEGLQLSPTTIWLLVIVGLMIVILLATWLFLRSLQKSSSEKAQTGKKKSSLSNARKPVPSAHTSEEREKALLQELLELDRAHEKGTLSDEDYRKQRKKAKAQLRELKLEQESHR